MDRGGTDLRTGPVQDWIELGRFGRSHALKGELRFHCDPSLSSLVTKGLLAYVRKTGGETVPVRLLSVREAVGRTPRGANNARLFFVTLDRIHSKEDADALRDLSLWLRPTTEIENMLREKEEGRLVGFAVHSDGMPFGVVADVLETPAHEILVVDLTGTSGSTTPGDGTQPGSQVLVPLTEPFIVSIDAERAVIKGRGLDIFKEV